MNGLASQDQGGDHHGFTFRDIEAFCKLGLVGKPGGTFSYEVKTPLTWLSEGYTEEEIESYRKLGLVKGNNNAS